VAEQVIIEFIGDTSSLNEAAQQIDSIGKKESDSLKKTNADYKTHADEKRKVIQLEKERQAALDKTIDKLAKETGQSKKELQDFSKVVTQVVGKAVQELTGEVNQYAGALDKSTKAMAGQAKEGQSLKSRLKEIQAELAAMETGQKAFDPKRFKELSKEAGTLKDAIGDVSARVNVLASDTQKLDAMISTATGIAGAFSVAQGAVALFGDENEDLQKALLKVQGTMAILNGLQAVQATLNKDSAFSITVLGAAQTAYNAIVGTSTGLMKVFRLALAATGIGAIILLVGALVANWDKISGSVMNSIKSLKEFSEKLGGIRGIFNGVVESLKSGFGKIGEIVSAVAGGEFGKVVKLGKGLGDAFGEGFNKGVKGVVDAFGEGFNKGAKGLGDAFGKGFFKVVKESIAAQAEELRIKEIAERIKTNERILRVQQAAAKDTIALERKILQDKIAVQKQGTDEYKDAVTDLQVFEAKVLADKKKNHKEEKESYIRSMKEQTEAQLNESKLRGLDKSRWIELEILQEKVGLNRKNEILKLERDLRKQNIDNTITDLRMAQAEKELIDKEYYDKLDLIDTEYWNKQVDREKERAKKTKELKDKELEDEKALNNQIVQLTLQTLSTTLSSFSEIARINAEEKLAQLEKQRDAELANTELTESEKLAINKKYDKEAKAIKRKAAEEEKALKIMQAIIGTAAAIVNALASGGPAAVALAAAAGIAGAAQIAVIARTPIPKFAKGTEFVERGANPRGIDTIPAYLNEGERVVDAHTNKALRGIPNSMLPKLVQNYSQQMPHLDYSAISTTVIDKGIDYDKLGNILAEKLRSNPQAVVKIDKAGFSTFIRTRNNQTEYLNNKFNA